MERKLLLDAEAVVPITEDFLPVLRRWGVPNDRGALLGFLTGVVLLIVLPRLLVASWTLSWVLFLFGALALPLGALMIKGWRLLVRVMS